MNVVKTDTYHENEFSTENFSFIGNTASKNIKPIRLKPVAGNASRFNEPGPDSCCKASNI